MRDWLAADARPKPERRGPRVPPLIEGEKGRCASDSGRGRFRRHAGRGSPRPQTAQTTRSPLPHWTHRGRAMGALRCAARSSYQPRWYARPDHPAKHVLPFWTVPQPSHEAECPRDGSVRAAARAGGTAPSDARGHWRVGGRNDLFRGLNLGVGDTQRVACSEGELQASPSVQTLACPTRKLLTGGEVVRRAVAHRRRGYRTAESRG